VQTGTTPINRGEPFEGLKKAGPSGILPDVIGLGKQDRVQDKPTMNPQTQFCHNPDCQARGQVGQGNIRVHGQVEQRCRCTTCGRPSRVRQRKVRRVRVRFARVGGGQRILGVRRHKPRERELWGGT
jgi:hypothetical protein